MTKAKKKDICLKPVANYKDANYKGLIKFIQSLLQQQREEMKKGLKEMFGDWWAGEGKADNVLIDRKRVLEEIDNYLKQND